MESQFIAPDNPSIDISARATPVKSVFDGYVSTITFIAGYGTVIIDHNNSYYSFAIRKFAYIRKYEC